MRNVKCQRHGGLKLNASPGCFSEYFQVSLPFRVMTHVSSFFKYVIQNFSLSLVVLTPICMHIAQPPLTPSGGQPFLPPPAIVVFQGRRVKREEEVMGGGMKEG